MSDTVFQPLVVLQRRPLPHELKGVQVNIINTGVSETRKPTIIQDKRKTSTIDRKLVLEKLREKNALLVKIDRKDIIATIPEKEYVAMPTVDEREKLVVKPKKKLVLKSQVEKTIAEPEEDVSVEAQEETEKEEAETKAIEKILEAEEPILLREEVEEKMVEKETPLPEPAKRGRKKKLIIEAPVDLEKIDLTKAAIRGQVVNERLPAEREKIIVKAPSYYMNNRMLFSQKLSELFKPYQKEFLESLKQKSGDNAAAAKNDFSMLMHQKLVRDYLNLYSPYRGLLLYHGLGSGKTCTSIAMAEGLKSEKRIYVLTPASLKMNFFSEMKKCGDDLYRKNQYWEFVSIEGNPEYVPILARALSLTTEYIRNQGGAWLINVKKPPNFTELKTEHQKDIDEQLNAMIRNKYVDINYNGLNMNKMRLLTGDFQHNPFDNSVVVVDEAHNLVSRIVNKIKKPNSISYMLYDYLMKAKNARVIVLTGTPIINYPNEIGVLFNMLRGYIKTWTITVNVKTTDKINTETILAMFEKENLKIYDYVEYSGNKLTITRNPFGFVNVKKRGVVKGTTRKQKTGGNKNKTHKTHINRSPEVIHIEDYMTGVETDPQEPMDTIDAEHAYRIGYNQEFNPHKGGGVDYVDNYNGVKRNESGDIDDDAFLDMILRILRKNGLEVNTSTIDIAYNKSLPDDAETFLRTFVNIETEESQNLNLFQRRILGLVSYFRSPREELLPRFELTADGDKYHIEKCEMTDHQFSVYEEIRKIEADKEKMAKKRRAVKDPTKELFTVSSTYRIFSRAACNFAFPPSIERPVPDKKEYGEELDEKDFDLVEPEPDADDEDNVTENVNYAKRIEKALTDINTPEFLSKENLERWSPKFARLLENVSADENKGLHLIYSHFRTIEGIGLLRLILQMNGFAEFKIKKTDDSWEIVENEEDIDKPKFVLYTGTETVEEKEIIRNVYNGMWEFVPSNISNILKQRAENNMYGEIIKIFMITASGAEGINLKNTRFVHIVESYWHNVRLEQVVGRARRINSHQELPPELRTVKVFLYLSTLSKEQKVDEKHIELRIRDVSRIDKKTPITTDEYLFEIASAKQRINSQILQAVKETAVDCNVYNAIPKKKGDEDHYVCYGEGRVESNQFSSYPSFERDQERKQGLNVEAVSLEARIIDIGKKKYALNEKTMELYDYESYISAQQTGSQLLLVGKLVSENGRYKVVKEAV